MTFNSFLRAGAILAASMIPPLAWAQTATISGSLSAFDVVNDTGQPVHGFEIQLEGAQPGDLYYTVFGGRYGTPTVTPYPTGVYIRYTSQYDSNSGQYTQTTPVNQRATFAWQDCYQGAGYNTSGCEHFGQSMRALPAGRTVTVTGHWLVGDPANPGTLIPLNPPVAIPFASWFVAAPTTFAAPPVLVAEVEAPEPPETPEKYGDAQWVKIYRTQLTREVTADELSSLNPAVVPESAAQVEVAWDILQVSPPSNGNQNRTRNRNQGGIAIDTRSIIRRYEVYKYTGAYDAVTHKVACADGTCTAPSAGELGGALSAQNTATNVTADSITVIKSGNGTVSGASGKISCGSACATFATAGSALSLTASPSGTTFGGWSGACGGGQLTCSLTVSGAMTVNAPFKSQFTLSIGRSNSGTVTGTPAGNDRGIDCGGNCSAKFTDGTAVTLTATPSAGKQFLNWSGACAGTASTCVVTISKDTSVQAVFSK
jgi:hypothetical protein